MSQRFDPAVDEQRLGGPQPPPKKNTDFLTILSHELRNPVAAVAGGFDVMRRDNFDPLTCQQIAPLISDQLNYISRLLDDLLDIARLRHGKMTLRRQQIDLVETVRNILAANRYRFRERHQVLNLDFPDEEIVVSADAIRLNQVVGNLLDNASRFSGLGKTVHVTVTRKGDEAVLQILDEGVGIDPQFAPKIFQPFEQHTRDPSTPLAGLGVGLSISRDLIRLHGGDITFVSEGRDQGTAFIIRLPCVDRDAIAAPPPARSGRSQRILVIEDSPAIQVILQRLLTKMGHDVTIAASGESGVEELQRKRFDSVLADIQLPGISGYDVATWVRRRWEESASSEGGEGDRPVLIAVTGYAQASDRQRSFEAGFDAHLSKPVSIDTLEDTLNRLAKD